mmetsp:Transcript_80920/g.127410  ORF Transcript_80920/g.127410 Transcript_80920/m.127410 type:complete len:101 (+) Transcript_80920:112-414(+)
MPTHMKTQVACLGKLQVLLTPQPRFHLYACSHMCRHLAPDFEVLLARTLRHLDNARQHPYRIRNPRLNKDRQGNNGTRLEYTDLEKRPLQRRWATLCSHP